MNFLEKERLFVGDAGELVTLTKEWGPLLKGRFSSWRPGGTSEETAAGEPVPGLECGVEATAWAGETRQWVPGSLGSGSQGSLRILALPLVSAMGLSERAPAFTEFMRSKGSMRLKPH